MSVLAAAMVSLPHSAFPPLAVGFMGLGTGYLIYGPQELFGFPRRDASVDKATGIWGLFMPGLMQLIAGTYLFVGLAWLGSFTTPALYMAATAFTAYGVHWFALGWTRMAGTDPRVNVGVATAFMLISILGIIVFFGAGDDPVGALFIGLTAVYVAELGASVKADFPGLGEVGERLLGLFHLLTGFWLIYLMFAAVLNFSRSFGLPL